MAEYTRTDRCQFVDAEIAITIDTHTGKIIQHTGHGAASTFEYALDKLKRSSLAAQKRLAIVKLPAVVGFELETNNSSES